MNGKPSGAHCRSFWHLTNHSSFHLPSLLVATSTTCVCVCVCAAQVATVCNNTWHVVCVCIVSRLSWCKTLIKLPDLILVHALICTAPPVLCYVPWHIVRPKNLITTAWNADMCKRQCGGRFVFAARRQRGTHFVLQFNSIELFDASFCGQIVWDALLQFSDIATTRTPTLKTLPHMRKRACEPFIIMIFRFFIFDISMCCRHFQ